jgi:histidine phosphotransferase ChpT
MDDRVRLAELVCARLCHDLSGLLGSLIGTLELLACDGEATEAVSIAVDTAAALGRRLKLLRAAWANEAEPLDLPRLASLAEGLANQRIALDVSALPPTTVFPPAMGRLVLNLLLLAADSLPRGGLLRLDGNAENLIARLDGPNAAWPPGMAGMLADEAAAWAGLTEPRSAQAPLTALLARHDGLHLSLLLASGPATPAPPLRLSTI